MKRIVGIDFGLKRIGVAISDAFQSFATPVGRIERGKDPKVDIDKLLDLLKGRGEIELFIVGLPLHLDGKESDMSALARSFGDLLREMSQRPVEFVDERLTSKEAEGLLMELSMKRKDRSKVVDTIAACLILQTYLHLKGK